MILWLMAIAYGTVADEVIQGPSDGKGGFLPSLKPMAATTQVAPAPTRTSASPTPGDMQGPPPLRRQQSSTTAMPPMARGQSVVSMYSQHRGSISSQGVPSQAGALPTRRNISMMSVGSQSNGGASGARGTYQQMPVFHPTRQTQPAPSLAQAPSTESAPLPRKKVSVIQEEDMNERPGSAASIPGEAEPIDSNM